MADAAMQRGYSYIAITDHSKGLKIAGGINEDQLAQQAKEIAAVNAGMENNADGFRVLRSIELNLSPTGTGDMDQFALRKLDLVLGCFHSALRSKEDQTERYLAALRNPSIHILGHPRGRIYNFRLGLTADWSRVFGLAAQLESAGNRLLSRPAGFEHRSVNDRQARGLPHLTRHRLARAVAA
jgi:histidinol phosphatase-like PHP family hydrolase